MNRPKVSVVITNFNGVVDLDLSLSALVQTSYPNIELIVADCCTPDFNRWITEKYPTLKSIHFAEDIGIGGLRNMGFQYIDKNSEFVCFIDDDIIVNPSWLDNMVNLMELNVNIGAVHPVRFNYSDKTIIDGLGYLMTRTGFPCKIETTEENLSQLRLKRTMDIFYGETAIMLVRMKVLLNLDSALEPFDKDHYFSWEDVDLSWRIWLLNYRVVVTSESFCYHNRKIDTRKAKSLDSRYTYLVTRGRFIAMMKNYEVSYLFKYLPLALMIDFTKAVLLLYYKPQHAFATFSALFWGVSHIQYVLRRRSKYRKPITRKNKDLDNIFLKTSAIDLLRQFKLNWL
jgi:GT2 family glycosyltransferase